MFDIAKYLEKFKIMGNSKLSLRISVAEAIKEICGIEIESKNIEIKDFVARISEKPIIKTQIFIKKFKILENIEKKTNGKIKELL